MKTHAHRLHQWLARTRTRMPAGSLLHWRVDQDAGVLWLERLMLPRHARQGAGSVLLARILEQCDRAGIAVELNANPTGQPGDPHTSDLVRWYGRFGFERLGEDKDGVQMRRTPAPAQSWEALLAQARGHQPWPIHPSRGPGSRAR